MYTIQEAKEEIKTGIKSYLLKDARGNYRYKETARMPFYLEGPPGVGKTEIVRQIAEELGIGFVSFSITHHTRNTLLGLPVIIEEEAWKYTKYTMPEIVAQIEERIHKYRKTEGILLLDEFNCASETIFPMMLAMLQTRNIGSYKIPEGWNIVLCGNPREYNRSARSFDAVILDRVRRIVLEPQVKEFLSYAEQKGMHPLVIKYLSLYKSNLYECNEEIGENKTVVTCRGWENLSHALYAYEELGAPVTTKLVEQFIKSEEIATAFAYYYEMNKDGTLEQQLEDIFCEERWEILLKKWENKSVAHLWNLLTQLGKILEKYLEKEKAPSISKKISLVLRFLGGMQKGDSYQERFFRIVTESDQLRGVMLKVRNEEYLSMCRSAFALKEKEELAKIA